MFMPTPSSPRAKALTISDLVKDFINRSPCASALDADSAENASVTNRIVNEAHALPFPGGGVVRDG